MIRASSHIPRATLSKPFQMHLSHRHHHSSIITTKATELLFSPVVRRLLFPSRSANYSQDWSQRSHTCSIPTISSYRSSYFYPNITVVWLIESSTTSDNLTFRPVERLSQSGLGEWLILIRSNANNSTRYLKLVSDQRFCRAVIRGMS